MTVTLQLDSDIERKLREKAALTGLTLEVYLARLAEQDVSGPNGDGQAGPQIADEEFERLLGELSAGPVLPRLPDELSRADIYSDHD